VRASDQAVTETRGDGKKSRNNPMQRTRMRIVARMERRAAARNPGFKTRGTLARMSLALHAGYGGMSNFAEQPSPETGRRGVRKNFEK
jgi:hypothetical protein